MRLVVDRLAGRGRLGGVAVTSERIVHSAGCREKRALGEPGQKSRARHRKRRYFEHAGENVVGSHGRGSVP